MEETDWNYLAGVVDSEGSFYISAERNDTFTHNFRLRPRFRMEMKRSEGTKRIFTLLEEAMNELDVTYKVREVSTQKNETYRIEISSLSGVIDFCSAIQPYLRHKTEIVDELLVFEKPTAGSHITEEKFEAMLEARRTVREHNANRDTKYDYERIRRESELD